MSVNVALIDFAVTVFEVARKERLWVITIIKVFKIHADVNTCDAVESVAEMLYEFLQQLSSVIVVTGIVGKTEVTFLGEVNTLRKLGSWIASDFQKGLSVVVLNREHFLIDASTIGTLYNHQTDRTEVVSSAWLAERFKAMDFQPIKIDTSGLRGRGFGGVRHRLGLQRCCSKGDEG